MSISILIGENGVLSQAQESKEKTDKTHIEEMKQLTASRAAMNLDGYTYTDKKGVSVYIPTNFAVSENPDEQTVEDGLVVIDKMGDEFVWVPVNKSSIDTEFIRRNGTGYQVGTFSELKDDYGNNIWLKGSVSSEIENNADKEKALVKKAGGFFVSRYEIGIISKARSEDMDYNTEWGNVKSSKNDRENTIASLLPTLNSKKGMEPVRMISQEEALELSNSWKVGKNYQSGLITGRTWDTMVNFVVGYNSSEDNNTADWGNFKDVHSITYKQIYISYGSTMNKWKYENNFEKNTEINIIFPTGEFINTKGKDTSKKNIFDVAGNLWEWTTEVPSNENNRVIRGDSVNNISGKRAVNFRGGDHNINSVDFNKGFRVVIYVNSP